MRASIYVAVVIVAGCGGSQLPAGAPPSESAPATYTHHQTFRYVGKRQFFKVPAGVTHLHVVAHGGNGGGSVAAYGGRVTAIIPVKPFEKLTIYVAGNGAAQEGGFNGGGTGGRGEQGYRGGNGFGGGGATDVREGVDSLKDRILVAGGAGGQGGHDAGSSQEYGIGGKGGGLIGGMGGNGSGSSSGCGTGSSHDGCPGHGGSQKSGGSGGLGGTSFLCYGTAGSNGSFGQGGDGENDASTSYECGGGGGAGGGGYYGGGAGGEGAETESSGFGGGGGGGGSSYVEASATDVHLWQGWRKGQFGLVVISW